MICAECMELMERTLWLPPPGIDPRLRLFECPNCNYPCFAIPRGREGYNKKNRSSLFTLRQREKKLGDSPKLELLF